MLTFQDIEQVDGMVRGETPKILIRLVDIYLKAIDIIHFDHRG